MTAPARVRIGVFDSGFGGLTVLRALLPQIPGAEFFYLGDTARLPYGSKSQATVARYAVESAQLLESYGADYLVIACNTASALALDAIKFRRACARAWSDRNWGRQRRCRQHDARRAGAGHAGYSRQSRLCEACAEHGLRSVEKACPLLVPLIEEGWIESPVTREVLRIYLEQAQTEAKATGMALDTVLLGCTHYPLLRRSCVRRCRTASRFWIRRRARHNAARGGLEN